MGKRGSTIDISKLPKKERIKIMERRERSRAWHARQKLKSVAPLPDSEMDIMSATTVERLAILVQDLRETRAKANRLMTEIRGLTGGKPKPLGMAS